MAHQKKRNTGLLYEFLVLTISSQLVEGKNKNSHNALRILKKFFKPGTELYREFRLINSLMKTTVSLPVAASILDEAKRQAMLLDSNALNEQKSKLIKQVNYAFGEHFYDQPVKDYKMYATIQTLFNEWRASEPDLSKIGEYEDKLVAWLSTPRETIQEQVVQQESNGESRLLMKIMMQKINEKYGTTLNEQQKSIVRAYAFSTANEEQESISKKLCEIKDSLVKNIDEYVSMHQENKYVNDKLTETKQQLVSESLQTIDDATIARFMLYSKLGSELTTNE